MLIIYIYSLQEALVLLLDVGPSMHNLLPDIEKLSSMLIQKKAWLPL